MLRPDSVIFFMGQGLVGCLQVFCIVLCLAVNAYAQKSEGDIVLGQWFTEGDNVLIEVYKCSAELYCGKIVWLKTPKNPDGTDKLDIHNPDPCKQKRKKIGLDIVWGFRYEGNYQWGGGKIYDPLTGETYSSRIKLERDTLKVRGYVGVPFLGRTTVCTRKSPALHGNRLEF